MKTSKTYIRHEVTPMAPGALVQECVRCGAVLTDYTNTTFISSNNNSAGWPAGAVYTSDDEPYWIRKELPEGERRVINCTNWNEREKISEGEKTKV